MGDANPGETSCGSIARAEAQRRLEMLDCEIGLPGVEPYPAAPTPAVSKTRIKLQGAVHQPDRRFDVLAKVTQHVASMGKYARIVSPNAKGLPGEVDRSTPVCIPTLRASHRTGRPRDACQ